MACAHFISHTSPAIVFSRTLELKEPISTRTNTYTYMGQSIMIETSIRMMDIICKWCTQKNTKICRVEFRNLECLIFNNPTGEIDDNLYSLALISQTFIQLKFNLKLKPLQRCK